MYNIHLFYVMRLLVVTKIVTRCTVYVIWKIVWNLSSDKVHGACNIKECMEFFKLKYACIIWVYKEAVLVGL
jgi:hypothetical protein